MYDKGAAWADLAVEYKDSLNKIKEVKNCRKNSANEIDKVDCEIAGSMESDLTEVARELKKKTLYEYNAITEEDIKNPVYGLTERQMEVTLLRQKYSCEEIAKKLRVNKSTIFRVYKTAIDKLIKKKQRECGNIGLSEKQQNIYQLYVKGIGPTEISSRLNISINSVKTHLRRIKKKIEGDKSMQFTSTG